MNKETFIKCMQQIQNFHSQQETLSDVIEKLSDGYCVFTMGNQLVDIILDLINKNLNIEDNLLLGWWLYEDVDKIIYDERRAISVKTLDELYNYIIQSYN